MQAKPSVHDNLVYAYVVDCEGRCVTLHTANRDREPHEFTDVVFRDVVCHHFEHVLSASILFDVEEADVAALVQRHKTLLSTSWRHGWPPVEYKGDLAVLVGTLKSAAVKAFEISSSYGLAGWILAGHCERVSRDRPAARS